MRIAVISDVHGNVLALDAALAHIAGQKVDLTVNLGDIVSGGLQPRETLERLIPLGLVNVRGNHDRQLLDRTLIPMGQSDRFAHSLLTDDHRAWLGRLPQQWSVRPGVLAFHGTPSDDQAYLLETVEAAGARPATEAEVVQRLGPAVSFDLLLCGHTHLQRSMRLHTGALTVNPGSVGWPAYADDTPFPHVMQAGTPHVRYAVVDNASGRWEVSFEAVDYDWEAAARSAESHHRRDIAHALRTGFVED
ncbi:MAG: metallophosphoesterase family protein [Janthinobacterium lividum]